MYETLHTNVGRRPVNYPLIPSYLYMFIKFLIVLLSTLEDASSSLVFIINNGLVAVSLNVFDINENSVSYINF